MTIRTLALDSYGREVEVPEAADPMRLAVFVCPKCRSKGHGRPGSQQWCYCRTPAVRMRETRD